MRGFSAATLLAVSIAGLVVSGTRADDGKPCAEVTFTSPAVQCLQSPPPKVVVEVSPPEVVFKQAPATHVQAPPAAPVYYADAGFRKRLFHWCKAQPVVAQPLAAPSMTVPVPQMTIPSVAMTPAPVQYAPVQYTPVMTVPQMTPSVAMAPVVPYAMAPMQAYTPAAPPPASFAPSQCQGSAGFSPADQTAALNMLQQLVRLAGQTSGSGRTPGQTPLGDSSKGPEPSFTPETTGGDIASKISDLQRRVLRLELIVANHEDRLPPKKDGK